MDLKVEINGDEITRHGFVSHLEAYIKNLLSEPLSASIDDYLSMHGVENPDLLDRLLKRSNPEDENSAILIRTERIKPDPETGKDMFVVRYRVPRKDYSKKLRHLYADLFENYMTNNPLLEDGEAMGSVGATNCDSTGQYTAVMKKQEPIRREIYLTEEQFKKLFGNEVLEEDGEAMGSEGATNSASVPTYDMPAFADAATCNHKNIFSKKNPYNKPAGHKG